MSKHNREETLKIMSNYFSKDNLLSVATFDENSPSVRCGDAYFDNGYFYIIAYALTNKMKQIEANPNVAFCSADWLTGHGKAENLGYIYNQENMEIAEKLKVAFSEWYNNGHNNYEDKNTIIVAIKVTDCSFYHDGEPYKVDFSLDNQ